MNFSSSWIVNQSSVPSPTSQSDHVMAWARDAQTGEPVYIQELDASRTGGKCGCECPSCELPLTAVNAAKTEYRKRPHFRHPNGAGNSDCMFLAARLAVLNLLKMQGVFTLPGRRLSAQCIGLSGTEHEAWVEHPPERVRFTNFDFRDRVAAILTLDDGRQLRVQLMGTGSSETVTGSDGLPIPTIILDVNDLAVASMSPKELRSKLTLVPANLCWVSHWSDQALQARAADDARQVADDYLDLEPEDGSVLDGIDPTFRRETLLHMEVKRILSGSKEIRVPDLNAKASKTASNRQVHSREWERPSELIALLDVQLEKRFGNVIPDVTAKVSPANGDVLMIEITVTNHISDERLVRIREKNVPTLEIDLSHAVGLISRVELTKWVVHGLQTKRWIHHPEIAVQKLVLEAVVDQKIEEFELAEQQETEFHAEVFGTNIDEIARDYLRAVIDLAQYDREEVLDKQLREAVEIARNAVALKVGRLKIRGYPEAVDPQLSQGHQAIISRIYAIQKGRGVADQTQSAMDVLNSIRESETSNKANHTLFLIAERAYRGADAVTPAWFEDWVNEIKASIKSGESTYLRSGEFDRLLSLLFPAIAEGLGSGYGTKQGNRNSGSGGKNLVRDYAPSINFVDVLRESEAIKSGEKYAKWFEIWSDRYNLQYDVSVIAHYLESVGFEGSIKALKSWEAYIQEIKKTGMRPLPHVDLELVWEQPYSWRRPAVKIKPEDNPYERRKG